MTRSDGGVVVFLPVSRGRAPFSFTRSSAAALREYENGDDVEEVGWGAHQLTRVCQTHRSIDADADA